MYILTTGITIAGIIITITGIGDLTTGTIGTDIIIIGITIGIIHTITIGIITTTIILETHTGLTTTVSITIAMFLKLQ